MTKDQSQSKSVEPKLLQSVQIRASKAWEHPQADSGEWLSKVAEVLLSENLVVLSGLGTSLCLKEGENSLAPTMTDLWNKARDIKDFSAILTKVGYPNNESNIED